MQLCGFFQCQVLLQVTLHSLGDVETEDRGCRQNLLEPAPWFQENGNDPYVKLFLVLQFCCAITSQLRRPDTSEFCKLNIMRSMI
jgi:hypothetical protein